MNRYYLLTKRDGVRVVEASAVDEFDPFAIRFASSSGISSFDRQELLCWSPVLATPPAPFSNFDSFFPEPGHHTLGTLLPWKTHGHHAPQQPHVSQSPWPGHGASLHQTQSKPEFHELSGAARDALITAVLPRVPPGWKKAALELKVIYILPPGRYQISFRLRNPDTGAEAFDFSDELSTAIEVFHRIHAEGRQNWSESTLTLHLEVKGKCRPEVRYNYGTNFGPR